MPPHYLRFARALSLVAGVGASTMGCTAVGEGTPDVGTDASADVGTDASADAGMDAHCTGCVYLQCETGTTPETGPPAPPLCPVACFAGQDTGNLICGPLAPPNLSA